MFTYLILCVFTHLACTRITSVFNAAITDLSSQADVFMRWIYFSKYKPPFLSNHIHLSTPLPRSSRSKNKVRHLRMAQDGRSAATT